MIHLLDSIRSAPGQKAFEWKARREAQGTAQPWQPPQFFTCPKCQRRATRAVWAEHLYVCPNCGQYQPIGGYYRLSMVLDHGSFRELNGRMPGHDPLHFPGYSEKLAMQKKKTGLDEAVVSAVGRIEGQPAVVVVMDSRFFMGSMGEGVGEKVTLAVEYAASGVMVNCVAPSMMETRFLADTPDLIVQAAAADNPMGRNCRVSDVVPAMAFLLSDEAGFITGVTLPVTGGSAIA